MRVLFLDVDGVLHPLPTCTTTRMLHGKPAGHIVSGEPFVWLALLARALEHDRDVALVVHSTCRLMTTPAELEKLFGQAGLHLLGCTPPGDRWDWISFVLTMNPGIADYCVLDNSMNNFPNPPPPHLIVCDPGRGVSDGRVVSQLKRWLQATAPKATPHGRRSTGAGRGLGSR